MGDARGLIGVEHVGEWGRRKSKLVNENSGLVGVFRPFGKTEESLEAEWDVPEISAMTRNKANMTKPDRPE